jgi:hypothetical protein
MTAWLCATLRSEKDDAGEVVPPWAASDPNPALKEHRSSFQ